MTTFNYKQIKTITINLNNGTWNPDIHDILLTRDTKSTAGFTAKFIPLEQTISDLSEANNLLKKFRLE